MPRSKRLRTITKPWREVTYQERVAIKKEQCQYCEYADQSRYHPGSKCSIDAITCDYIRKGKHSRGCRPDVCDKFVRRQEGQRRPRAMRVRR